MSKSYIVNGRNILNKCLRKASEENPSVVLELNNVPIYSVFGALLSLKDCSQLELRIIPLQKDMPVYFPREADIAPGEEIKRVVVE